jgi:hypothetical protein
MVCYYCYVSATAAKGNAARGVDGTIIIGNVICSVFKGGWWALRLFPA